MARHLYGSTEEPAAHDMISGIEFFDKVISVDQSPIGRTPRSNPATYTGLFTPIRELFSGVPESRARGYGPGRFSFNVKGGRCEACQGDGVIKWRCTSCPTFTYRATCATGSVTTAKRWKCNTRAGTSTRSCR